MTATTKNLTPITGLSNDQLEVLAFMIAGKLQGVIVDDKPMNGDEAIKWTGWSKGKFFRLVKAGFIRPRQLPDSDPFYLKSDIIEYLKTC